MYKKYSSPNDMFQLLKNGKKKNIPRLWAVQK